MHVYIIQIIKRHTRNLTLKFVINKEIHMYGSY